MTEDPLVPKIRGGGGGGTCLREANGDVPLNGVAFSRLDCGRKFLDVGGKKVLYIYG